MKKMIDNFMHYRHFLKENVIRGIKVKYRNSYLGIVWTLIALLLVFAGLFSPVVEKIVVGGVIHVLVAVMIGVCCIIGGVKSICFCKQAQLEGKSMAWSIVGGILSIIAGTVVFMYPIGSVLVLTIIYGLFLVISGIALLCRASSF